MKRRTRDRILIGVSAAVAVGSALVVGNYLRSAAEVQVATTTVSPPTQRPGELTVQFLGDTMVGDAAQPFVDKHGYLAPFAKVRSMIDSDYTIANLETAVTSATKLATPGKDYSYSVRPRSLWALKQIGVDAVGLANNHSMDFGAVGLNDTLEAATAHGLETFGAGSNLDEAAKPLVIEGAAGRITVSTFTENYGSHVKARSKQSGTVFVSPDTVQRGIDLARATDPDLTVAFVHWGDNYLPLNAEQRQAARMLVDAGYDLIIGSGPHVRQPVRVIDGVPVVYSLGNFVFGTPGRFDSMGMPGIGLDAQVSLSQTGRASLRLRCLETDNEQVKFQPRPCAPAEAQKQLRALSPKLTVQGNSATMDIPGSRQ